MSRGFESHTLRRSPRSHVGCQSVDTERIHVSTASAPRARRRTVARHGQLSSPGPISTLTKMVLAGVAAVVVAVLGVASFVVYDLASSYTANAVDIGGEVPPSIGEIEGGANILIAGTDQCEPEYAKYFGDRCGDGAEEGVRSDVNLLVHISDAPRRVTVVSFPRDLMLPIPSCTDANGEETYAQDKAMLNSAFGTGGLPCTVKTIEALTGVDVQYAASINWGGVIDMTNAIGGVTVCIANGMKDDNTGIDWPAGERTVSGYEALQFLRTRYGVNQGSDIGRISNQQQYMSRLAKKMMSEEVLTNPITVFKLAQSALAAIDPSTSLTDPYTLVEIANAVKSVKYEDIVFLSYPILPDPWDSDRVVPNQESGDAIFAALETNWQLVITGTAGEGVVPEETAGDAEAPPTYADAPTETTAPATPAVPEGSVALPSDVTGQTAADNTCSYGNVRN